MIDIYLSDWTFYMTLTLKEKAAGIKPMEFVVKDVVCRRIPVRFLLNDGIAYQRAIKCIYPKTLEILEDNKQMGLKKFNIQFIKKIGEVNL